MKLYNIFHSLASMSMMGKPAYVNRELDSATRIFQRIITYIANSLQPANPPQLSMDCIHQIVRSSGHNTALAKKNRYLERVQNVVYAPNVLASIASLPHFSSVIEAAHEELPALKKLGQIVRYAKKQMTHKEYMAIRRKYPDPVCSRFFQELHTQIHKNKDLATLLLAEELGVRVTEILQISDIHKRAEAMRAELTDGSYDRVFNARTWLKLPKECRVWPEEVAALLFNIEDLDLSGTNLPHLPELNLPRLKTLELPNELVSQANKQRFPNLEYLNGIPID